MKKRGLLAGMAIGIAALVGTLTGCTTDGGKTAGKGFIGNTADAMAFSAVSSCALLDQKTAYVRSQTMGFDAGPAATVVEEPDPLEAQIEEVNKYLNIFEGMIGSSALDTQTVKDATYKDVTYQTQTTVTVANLDGSKTVYVMYYNETPKTPENSDEKGEEESENEQGTADQSSQKAAEGGEGQEDEDEEIETRLEGVLVLDGVDYAILGEKEVEEGESEVKFVSTAADGSSIQVKQEIEEDEQSFRYTYFDAAGVKVSESKIEIEQEKDEVEIELRLTSTDADGKAVTQSYKFEKEMDEGKTKLKIQYFDGKGQPRQAKVEIKTDDQGKSFYSYKFQDGKEKEMDRADWEDDDED